MNKCLTHNQEYTEYCVYCGAPTISFNGGVKVLLNEHFTNNKWETKHFIDCDKDPVIPEGMTIEKHIKGGQFVWDLSKIELYLSEKQKNGFIYGNDLYKELENKPILNACVLDYLLEHQELIPDAWKSKYVYFWGTIYRDSSGSLYVRCVYWSGGQWCVRYHYLGSSWRCSNPAAVSAS